ncbi:THAP domain-containing protein 3 isoform X2 [Anabrus simplex]|uniref:THAP domain-containing protein 3 isoform X2 n=1 Tax=Anabrus simplex TaxID=316456 RepID=UPI0035A3C6E3
MQNIIPYTVKRMTLLSRFPLKNKKLTKQWVINMKRDKWYPKQQSTLCSEHFEEHYMYEVNDRRRLLPKAIPTIFKFPPHLQRKQSSRKPPKKRVFEETASITECDSPNLIDKPENFEGSNEDHNYCLPSPKKLREMYDCAVSKNDDLRRKLKTARQIVVRQKMRIQTYERVICGLNRRIWESSQ